MSHSPERSEKVCLNCGALLHGRYCHVCGQENVEPKETVGHLIRHFFEDVTHFDGKFFSTIKLLITKPGYLSAEYMAGRRARYLNPIRMYLFISFVFFFVFFAFVKPEPSAKIRNTTTSTKTADGRDSIIYSRRDTVKSFGPTFTVKPPRGNGDLTLAQYLAHQDSLPESKRDGVISRYFNKRTAMMRDAQARNNDEFTERTLEKLLHSLPQMFFVLLPLFALSLSLLYIRRRRAFNYVAHAIFTVHFYSLVFTATLFVCILGIIPHSGIITIPLLLIYLLIYLYKAMHNFYAQGAGKTFIKFVIQNLIVFILFILLAAIYAATAAFNSVV